jgi:formate hydrogenlyase subunit 3/multisubunit Na+/H+ antiporter MnhD subunit
MHGTEMLVAILIPLGFFTMVFGIVYMFKRENLAMIEKGMNPKNQPDRPVPYKNLKWGLLLVGSGLGLLIAFFLDQYILPQNRNQYDESIAFIYFALLAIGGGLGLIRSYSVEKAELLNKRDRTEL